MRLFLPSVLALLVLAAPVSPVQACIWDSGTDYSEAQFKSSYQDDPGGLLDFELMGPFLVMGVGLGLLVAAILICRRAAREAEPPFRPLCPADLSGIHVPSQHPINPGD
jgi:hypothetical protein